MRRFTCDFETTTDESDCRVWAWALFEIGSKDNFIYGNSIETLVEWCKNQKDNVDLYFHNLRFDGCFWCYYLESNGYRWVEKQDDAIDNSYTTLITDMGAWYSIEVYFEVKGHHTNKVRIFDSLKILNFSVADIAKGFGLPISKLELDYDTYRAPGHKLTPHEVDYIRNDVEIVARALDIMFKQGLNKMTISSDALAFFKKMCPNFKKLFPELPLDIDKDIRATYKGGFTYLNPLYKEKETGSGYTFDINSLYPSVMRSCPAPYDTPIYFEGEYEPDTLYPLYTQSITCYFKVKPGKIPSIQVKSGSIFAPNEYIEDSGDDPITLTLTSPDLELFFEQYDVEVVRYGGGYKFKSAEGVFTKYVDHWTEQKIKASKEGNKPQRQIAKLLMNSLYGRLGLNPRGAKKRPFIGDDLCLHDVDLDIEERKPIWVAGASFITSFARCKTIRSAQAVRDWSLKNKGYDAFVYADTDSMHITGLDHDDLVELGKIIEIDDYKLGAWKVESRYWRGKYLRQKCYIEEWPDGTLNATIAGLPKKLGHIINFENFKVGFNTGDFTDEEIGEAGRKLTYKRVPGGVVLVPVEFSIN